MGSASKERLFGATIDAAEQRQGKRRVADVATCEAWYSHEGLRRPGAAIALLGDALNAGYRYLEVKCDGCGTHNTVDLTIIRRPKETPIWQLEQCVR